MTTAREKLVALGLEKEVFLLMQSNIYSLFLANYIKKMNKLENHPGFVLINNPKYAGIPLEARKRFPDAARETMFRTLKAYLEK